jgi:hypothetical protein
MARPPWQQHPQQAEGPCRGVRRAHQSLQHGHGAAARRRARVGPQAAAQAEEAAPAALRRQLPRLPPLAARGALPQQRRQPAACGAAALQLARKAAAAAAAAASASTSASASAKTTGGTAGDTAGVPPSGTAAPRLACPPHPLAGGLERLLLRRAQVDQQLGSTGQ